MRLNLNPMDHYLRLEVRFQKWRIRRKKRRNEKKLMNDLRKFKRRVSICIEAGDHKWMYKTMYTRVCDRCGLHRKSDYYGKKFSYTIPGPDATVDVNDPLTA